MLEFLKSFFNPKNLIKQTINALDLAVPFIASEFDKIKGKPFAQMTSIEQAQKSVDAVQAYMRKTFKIEA